jgi:hypothetical protein
MRFMLSIQVGMVVLISAATGWQANPNVCLAQSMPRALVVVSSESDAKTVRRIGHESLRVEWLFAPEQGAEPEHYDACNTRVRSLLDFQLFIVGAETFSFSERFWQERLMNANPTGVIHQLPPPRRSPATAQDHEVQQAISIHHLLVTVFPEQRISFDTNLRAELQRLQSRRLSTPQLATGR